MNYTKRKKNISIAWLFFIIITVIYGLVLIVLYRNQTNLELHMSGDLVSHMHFALTGEYAYTLMYIILGFLCKLPCYQGVFIALFLTIVSMLSIFFTYIFFKMHIKNVVNVYLYAAALVCNIYMPIHIPFLYISPIVNRSSPYLGMTCFNLYHNSTYISMKPFALLSVIIFIKLMNKYHTKPISILEWLCFAFALFITTWFKPSFAFGFAPSMLIFMIIDFIKGKGKNILNYILFGTTIIPTIGLMLWQKTQLLDQQSGIEFGFLKVWRVYSNHPLINIILSTAFPLVVLVFCYRDIIVDKIYQFGWLFALVNIFIFAFLYEPGPRLTDGNFMWSAHFAVGLLFVISMYKFLDKIKHMSKFKLIIVSSVLGMHILCGINYILKYLIDKLFL